METLTNLVRRDKCATRQAQNTLCVIVGWRRICGTWADIHEVVPSGVALVRETTGFRLMHSEAYAQEMPDAKPIEVRS